MAALVSVICTCATFGSFASWIPLSLRSFHTRSPIWPLRVRQSVPPLKVASRHSALLKAPLGTSEVMPSALKSLSFVTALRWNSFFNGSHWRMLRPDVPAAGNCWVTKTPPQLSPSHWVRSPMPLLISALTILPVVREMRNSSISPRGTMSRSSALMAVVAPIKGRTAGYCV